VTDHIADGMVLIKVAAPKLGLSPRQVRRLCASRTIPARKLGRSWLVNAGWLADFTSLPATPDEAAT
jgi:hypothetical protein